MGISLVLLVTLVRWIDPAELLPVLKEAKLLLVAAAILLLLFNRVLLAFRWRLVLQPYTNQTSTRSLLRISLVSGFLSTFLPSQFSADSLRVYLLNQEYSRTPQVISSVFVDRVAGFCVLSLAAGLAAIMAYQSQLISPQVAAIALLMPPAVGAVLIAAFSGYFRRMISHLRGSSNKLATGLGDILSTIRAYPWTLRHVLRVMVYSTLVYVLGIFAAYLMFRGVAGYLNPLYFFWIIPIIYISTLLPISVGGLGVEETAWAVLLGQAGVQLEQSLVFALTLRVTNLGISAIGGIVFALGRSNSTDVRNVREDVASMQSWGAD